MKKFLFINNALSGTGGARVILNLSQILLARGNDVSILLDRVDNIDFDINQEIKLYIRTIKGIKPYYIQKNSLELTEESKQITKRMNIPSSIKFFLKKVKNCIKSFFSIIDSYWYFRFIKSNSFDVVVNNNIYSSLDRIYFEKMISENYYVNFHNSPNEVFSRKEFFKLLPFNVLFKDVNVIAVSQGIINELDNRNDFPQSFKQRIYNPFNAEEINSYAYEDDLNFDFHNYIAIISSLSPRKRIDRAIKSFHQIKMNHSKIKMIILGEGELKDDLIRLTEDLSLQDEVYFLGFTKNPYKYLAKAKLLLLTSDSEGLPTVIIESLILGVPVVSTDCPTGPNEILVNWEKESLVKISSDITEKEIISDVALKATNLIYKEYSKNYVISRSGLERFADYAIATQWERL